MQQKTELLMSNCGITAAGFSVLAEAIATITDIATFLNEPF